MSGGDVGGALYAYDSSTVTIMGFGFAVDGSPVPYDDLTKLFGTLTGTLVSGEPIDNIFYQGGGSYTGTITLAPEPSTTIPVPALKPAGLICLAASLLGLGLLALATRRRCMR